ncbi:MAG: hypothetical protein IPJ62_16210 [Betaproteobacteria bacterium]|nr:hypothetical protein [Betaproteobacteria bacterium]
MGAPPGPAQAGERHAQRRFAGREVRRTPRAQHRVGAAYFKDVGLFPVTNDALAAVAADPYATNWSRNARTSRRDETSNWANAADLTTIVGEEVQGALLGQKSPQAAIDAMASRLEPRMREVRPK